MVSQNKNREWSREKNKDRGAEPLSNIIEGITKDLKTIPKKLKAKAGGMDTKKLVLLNLPYIFGRYFCDKVAWLWRVSEGVNVGSDPLGNISCINHTLESMPKQLTKVQTKFETAKVEITKPFAQKAELAEKLDRLSTLNALLNMDEKGNDGIDMDDEPETPKSEKEVADRPAKNTPLAEKAANIGQDKSVRQYAHAPAERVSLKAKLETMKAKIAGGETEKPIPQRTKKKRYEIF